MSISRRLATRIGSIHAVESTAIGKNEMALNALQGPDSKTEKANYKAGFLY